MTSTLAVGARSLVPDELLEGYGEDASLPDGWLIRPAEPLRGRVVREGLYPSPAIIRVHVGASEFPIQTRRLLIWQSAYDAILGGIGRAKGLTSFLIHPNPAFVFRWRAQGSSDAWKEVPGTYLGVSLSTTASTVTSGARVVGQVIIKDFRLDPTSVYYDAGAPDLPGDTDIIEFFLIGTMPPDELHPLIIEGVAAGQVVKNVYDGIYSERDSNGDVVPTGIRYDSAALALMTTPVRIRLTEPVDDARDWLEKFIYAPTGYIPALDNEGRVSPVSQVAPTEIAGLPVIYGDITEVVPEWRAGNRIINVVRFHYQRDYSIGVPDPPPPVTGETRQNLIEGRDVLVQFRDEFSIARHGEQALELDGECFRAIGRNIADDGDTEVAPESLHPRRRKIKRQLVVPLTEEPIVRPGAVVVPVSGDVEDEVGWILAQHRGAAILPRWGYGAPTMRVPVMRSATFTLRAGSFVALDLSWFPDYVTRRRGVTETLAQIVAIGDLDCAWRQITVEVVPLPAES